MRIGAAAAAGVAAVPQAFAAPSAAIRVRVTAGAKRLAEAPPLAWRAPGVSSAEAIVLDPSRTYQDILGFGGAFTDAACANFHRLEPGARDTLLRELFGPAGLGLGACRICVGSSDYSSSVYSFDEGEPDPEMRRFSIDHDRGYILPTLAAARAVNRDLYLLASPWSPPGWMKANGSMLGGSMRKPNFAAYARYLAAFLEAYAAAGVPVDALTVQNEVDTDQDGKMPACLWGQEYEIGFIANHLGPELAARKLATKIWLLDHNYNLWGRAVAELDDPKVNRYVDGVAWHGYVGDASAMTRVHEAYPEKHAYWTEGGSDFSDPRYLTNWTHWGATFAGILRNWARTIMVWNLALDEHGKPNIGPFSCGGMVTIYSETREIQRSGLYWALAHYSRAAARGARRIASEGHVEGVSHVAFRSPSNGYSAVLTNSRADERQLTVRMGPAEVAVALPADSVTTLEWDS
jgi:glucosylceramidase